MKIKSIGILMVLTIITSLFSFSKVSNATSTPPTIDQLAIHWSPIIYHDVAADRLRSDFITNFDYDGDWIGNNNWDNRDNYSLNAYVYYSVQETLTHYFITYGFFHPRDDHALSVDRHENDFEGILSVIKKDGSTYGSMIAMETQFHGQQYQYSASGSGVQNGHEDIDGTILFDGSHPKVFIEANGHGVKAYNGSSAPGGDGIVYKYTGIAQEPTNCTGSYTHEYGYAFKSMDDFWDRREDIGSGRTYISFGKFEDNNYSGHANSPWNWDDNNDGANFNGMIWSDPAYYIDQHLNGLGNFSHTYVNNKYYTHKITIKNVTPLVKSEGLGMGNPDLFFDVIVGSQKYVDPYVWKRNECAVGTEYPVRWGFDNAQEHGHFSEYFNTIYVAQPSNSKVQIKLYDSDSTGDDFMGSLEATPAPSQTIEWVNAVTSNGNAKVTATIETNSSNPTAFNGMYKIINRKSGLCLDVPGSSATDGKQLIQYSYNGGNNQKWYITPSGDGSYKLRNVNSNKIVDIFQASSSNGTAIVQWPYNGGDNQKWYITHIGDGYYKLTSRLTSKALVVENGSTASEAKIVQSTYSNDSNRNDEWLIVAP